MAKGTPETNFSPPPLPPPPAVLVPGRLAVRSFGDSLVLVQCRNFVFFSLPSITVLARYGLLLRVCLFVCLSVCVLLCCVVVIVCCVFCVYVSVFMYVCMYLSVCMCLCMYVCPYIHVYMHICMNVWIYMNVRMFVCFFMYMYVWVNLQMYISYVYSHTRPYLREHLLLSVMTPPPLPPFSPQGSPQRPPGGRAEPLLPGARHGLHPDLLRHGPQPVQERPGDGLHVRSRLRLAERGRAEERGPADFPREECEVGVPLGAVSRAGARQGRLGLELRGFHQRLRDVFDIKNAESKYKLFLI